jgi:hypothetical protein
VFDRIVNGYLLAVLSRAGGSSAVPSVNPGRYPLMAALMPSMSDFGSVAGFDRMLEAILAGIRDRVTAHPTWTAET